MPKGVKGTGHEGVPGARARPERCLSSRGDVRACCCLERVTMHDGGGRRAIAVPDSSMRRRQIGLLIADEMASELLGSGLAASLGIKANAPQLQPHVLR